ncbi:DrmB family protein [Pseudonocardia sp. CA-142604]|uniref:DrmB family protein n=1 Tax=Pseudonocardia sp. CA-142604 TaxID=3240024 RepID=UPI003D8BCD92
MSNPTSTRSADMPSRVRRRASGEERPFRDPLGSVRRSQLITTYGVGAVVALDEQSYIVSGLDDWKIGSTPDLHEFRLQTRLGVDGFRLPPAADPPAGDGVRARRFPTLYSCPGRPAGSDEGCQHNLKPYREFNSPRKKNVCAACGEPLTPSRFVVACVRGHLDEFPYWRWVHAGSEARDHDGRHELSVRTTGRTASLRSIVVGCSCGKEASMEGAFGPGAMASIGHTCSGARPWLGPAGQVQGCDAECRTMQRGSSAAWFPIVRSALSIPPFSDRLYRDIRGDLAIWIGETDDVIAKQARLRGFVGERYTEKDVIEAVRQYERYQAGERPDPSALTGFEGADVLRVEEFRQLCEEGSTDEFECSAPPDADEAEPPDGIDRSMQVHRLREVRVLQTFTRVEPPVEGDSPERLAAVSRERANWLPGIEVVGEGVFLSLDTDKLTAWEAIADRGSPERRAAIIRAQHEEVMNRRAKNKARRLADSPVRARLLLVHTLAHALINEWSLDAGYPASALRERLYVSGDMAGLLIYTASSDSAGSLGGLVSQGEIRQLQRSLAGALERTRWCSSDPLCMEAEASGTDSLNLAACHACVLLPETSCELNNTFLDRAMLIGTPDRSCTGYFDNVI